MTKSEALAILNSAIYAIDDGKMFSNTLEDKLESLQEAIKNGTITDD